MKAVLLAGGFGTRLRPLTTNIPKPMVPVMGYPIINHVVFYLKKYGFSDIICILFHQPEIIKNYLKDGSDFGVDITYIEADRDFGTAGAVKLASQYLTDDFLVISADLITDFDLNKILKFHKAKKAAGTISLAHIKNPLEYGIVILNKNKTINKFLEKPTWGQVFSDTVNTGIYVLNSKILTQIPENTEFDFSHDLFPKIIKDKQDRLFGFVGDGYWRDIGNLAEYVKVHFDYVSKYLDLPTKISSRGKNLIVSPSSFISDDSYLGDGCVAGDNTQIISSIIGKNCQIGRGSILNNVIIWDNVIIGKETKLDNNIIASDVVIRDRNIVQSGTVIGEKTVVESDSIIKPYIKIWPGKNIEEGSIVSSSIIWRQKWTRGVFGPYGITGTCNIEITPEFAASIGAAYGNMIGMGSYVVASRDSHKCSRIIYRALVSGVLSSGVNISDLEMVPIPVARYELKALKTKGGFHVRKSPYDPDVVDIKFFDEDGMDIPAIKEKNIERLYFREDFKRPTIEETGELEFPFYRVAKQYKDGLLSFVDKGIIESSRLKIVIDYAYGSASNIFPSILGDLGTDVVAINAHIDESKITKTKEQFDKSLTQLSQIVTSLAANFGVMLDTGAEKVFLVDGKGRILSGEETLGVMTELVCKVDKPKIIATPVTSSLIIEKLAKCCGARVVRTRTGSRYMMEAVSQPDVSYLGESWGGFIFSGFQPAFDGMLTVSKLIELLSKDKRKLSDVLESIPKTSMSKKEFLCPIEKKGILMRQLIESTHEGDMELIDGIKIHFDNGWALILLDPIRPAVQLYAEANTQMEVSEIVRLYSEKIEDILKK